MLKISNLNITWIICLTVLLETTLKDPVEAVVAVIVAMENKTKKAMVSTKTNMLIPTKRRNIAPWNKIKTNMPVLWRSNRIK